MSDNPQKHMLELGIESFAELLLFLYPYGAEQMGLPHNFWLGLGSCVVATTIAIRMFWIFPLWEKRLSRMRKGLIAFISVVICVSVSYTPVLTAYGKRDTDVEEKNHRVIIAGFTETGKNVEGACYEGEWGKAQDDAKAWSNVVSEWLTDNLGKDYTTRFNSSEASGPPDARYNPVQQQCWIFVSSRVAALNQIDSELNRK